MDYRKLFRDALEAETNELKTLHDNKIIKKPGIHSFLFLNKFLIIFNIRLSLSFKNSF